MGGDIGHGCNQQEDDDADAGPIDDNAADIVLQNLGIVLLRASRWN
ncbi:MAG: hypothetical protein R3C30_08765 [Hyphomonadaceae bacterium]